MFGLHFKIIHIVFSIYSFLLMARILLSWIPNKENINNFHFHSFCRFLHQITEPYLSIFRRFIPPLGGMLDISPIVAIFSLKLIKIIILYVV